MKRFCKIIFNLLVIVTKPANSDDIRSILLELVEGKLDD